MQKKAKKVIGECSDIFKALLDGGYIDQSRNKDKFEKLQKILEGFDRKKKKDKPEDG